MTRFRDRFFPLYFWRRARYDTTIFSRKSSSTFHCFFLSNFCFIKLFFQNLKLIFQFFKHQKLSNLNFSFKFVQICLIFILLF